MYIENPKTIGSGILCAIPQKERCINECSDCFFQSGRSYLEPLDKNLPNIPTLEMTKSRVVKVNDGNDSNNQREIVESVAKRFRNYFFNTSIPKDLETFSAPVVFTCNPGELTNKDFLKLAYKPKNLMFVRIRVNTWNNCYIVQPAVNYYTSMGIRIVLTYMAYYVETIPEDHKDCYEYKKRTLNSYWCIKNENRRNLEFHYRTNKLVYICGYKGTHECHRCGNCLREYFRVKEEMCL